MSQTFYDILGVPADASDTDLKKAYRQLSLKYHPDRCSDPDAAQTMQKVNEAYETLSDPEARKQYDFSLAHPQQAHPPNMDFMFQQMFGGFPFAQMFGAGVDIEIVHGPGGATFIRQRPRPTIVQISITLEQAFAGAAVPVTKPGTSEIEIVDVPAGVHNGHTIPVAQDFQVRVNISPHHLFQRSGDDLRIKKTLSLKEALCGAQLQFIHLNGKCLTLNISNAVVSPGTNKSFPGMGFTPSGSLIVEFDVVFPTTLTQEQRDALSTVL